MDVSQLVDSFCSKFTNKPGFKVCMGKCAWVSRTDCAALA